MRWSDRRSDFGHSELQPPKGMRMIPIDMPNGEVWRFELESHEDDTPELRTQIEDEIAVGIIPYDTVMKTSHHVSEQ